MRRLGFLFFVLLALLFSEGCKRASSEKQAPVLVKKEGDYIHVDPNDSVLKKTERKKAITLDAEKLTFDEKGALKFPESVFKADAEINWAEAKEEKQKKLLNEAQKQLADQKEARGKKKRLTDTELLGQEFVLFRKDTPPKDQSMDRFVTFLRRQSGVYEAKSEKQRREQVTELADAFKAGALEVTFFYFPKVNNQIIARHKTEDDKLFNVYQVQIAAPNVPVFPLIKLSDKDLKSRLEKQEMDVLSKYVWDYAIPYFINTPTNKSDDDRLKNLLNMKAPSSGLANVRQQMPQYVKKDPDAHSYEGFKKWAQEQVPAEIMKELANNKYKVNIQADFRNPGDFVVCAGKAEGKENEKTYLTMTCNGTVGNYDVRTVNQRFQQK